MFKLLKFFMRNLWVWVLLGLHLGVAHMYLHKVHDDFMNTIDKMG